MAGYQVDRAPVSTGSYWSGNYIDRAFTCRDWSEYGKGKLDIGVAFVVYCRDCIYSGEGTIEVNTYFLWNYCGIYCCADLLWCWYVGSQKRCVVGFSTVCVSTVFVGTYFVYDAGGYCSGDRTHWGCVCGKHCDGKRLCKRSRVASHTIRWWLGMSLCRFIGRTSCNYLFGSYRSHVAY